MSPSSDKSASAKLRLVHGAPASDPAPGAEDVSAGGVATTAVAVDSLADESLVALVMGGDLGAAELLYRRHATFCFNLATRIAGSTNDVEDVVHDAYLRAFDSLATLRNPKAFKSWLGSIVVHAMRSRLRRARMTRFFGLGRGGDLVEIDCLVSDEASPAARAELAQVYALLRTLRADDRIAWTLRFVDGHALKTAADLCDCSLATIKRRIRRAQRYIEGHFVGTQQADDESTAEEQRSSEGQAKQCSSKTGTDEEAAS